jgi:hypothetical protein
MFLDIVHHPVFYLKHRPVYISKHNVSETGFCLRLQVKPTQLGQIDRASPYLQTVGSSCFEWAQLSRYYLKMVTETSLRNVVLKYKQDGVLDKKGRWIMSRNIIFVQIFSTQTRS